MKKALITEEFVSFIWRICSYFPHALPLLLPLNRLHYPPPKLLGSEDGELAAVAKDGVHDVIGGIAAEDEERGVGRILDSFQKIVKL